MQKTLPTALSLEPKAVVDDDDRRRDASSRRPSLGRRATRRAKVLLGALIVDHSGDSVVSCRVENVSDNGARIKLAGSRFLPPTFWLIAVTSGLAYSAKMIWREDDRLGVEVGEPIDLRVPATRSEQRLHKIWIAWR